VRFIEVSHGNWDHHAALRGRIQQAAREVDQPIAALIADLKQRGSNCAARGESRIHGRADLRQYSRTDGDGAPTPAHLRWIHVWVNKNDGWRLVAHQSPRLPK
jgi:hypothetical protein